MEALFDREEMTIYVIRQCMVLVDVPRSESGRKLQKRINHPVTGSINNNNSLETIH